MKAILISFLIISLAALVYLGYAHFSGGAIPTFGLPLGGSKAEIRYRVQGFFEQIKFRNKEKLKEMIDSKASQEELYNFLFKLFDENIDNIDLKNSKINKIEIDSLNERGKAEVWLSILELTSNNITEKNKILFLYYDLINNNWLIDVKNLSN